MKRHPLVAMVSSAWIACLVATMAHAQAVRDTPRVVSDTGPNTVNLTDDSVSLTTNSGGIFFQVERPAAMDTKRSARPKYPNILRDYRISGSATMQFVVDTTGRVEMANVRILKTQADISEVPQDAINGGDANRHELELAAGKEFAKAVQDALPDMRYFPAEIRGHKVRQLVVQSFTFNVTPSAPTPDPSERVDLRPGPPPSLPSKPAGPSDCQAWLEKEGYKVASMAQRSNPHLSSDSVRKLMIESMRPCADRFSVETTPFDQLVALGQLRVELQDWADADRAFHRAVANAPTSGDDRVNALQQIISTYVGELRDTGFVFAAPYFAMLDSIRSPAAQLQAFMMRARLLIHFLNAPDEKSEAINRQMRDIAKGLPPDRLQGAVHSTVANVYRSLARDYANRLQVDSARAVLAAAARDVPSLADSLSHDLAGDSARYAMIGRPAPDISGETWLNHPTRIVATDTATVLMFTEEWCDRCESSYSTLKALDSTWGPRGFRMVFEADLRGYLDGRPVTIQQEIEGDRVYFVERHKFTNPIVLQPWHRSVTLTSISTTSTPSRATYRVDEVEPQFFVIDKAGIVRAILQGWDLGGARARALTAAVEMVMRTPSDTQP